MALLKRKRVGAGDAMEVVTKFVNACNRHDADGVSACLHPDFDSIQPMYPARNFRGADQVRRNWQAIFDAEPGFRLTVLRSAAMDDTVWLELHGAGREAEVAGIFIMGIVGDRIRWARIYSALVEAVPAGMGEPPAPLHEVPRTGSADDGELVESELIAPVLDMEKSTGRRRRRRAEADAAAAAEPAPEIVEEAGSAEAAEPAVEEIAGDLDVEALEVDEVRVVEMVEPVAAEEGDLEPVATADTELAAVALVEAGIEPVAVIEGDAATTAVGTDAETVIVVETEDETFVAVETAPAPAPASAFDEGLDTEAVPAIVWADDPAPEPQPEPQPTATEVEADVEPAPEEEAPAPTVTAESPEEPRRRFGKRRF